MSTAAPHSELRPGPAEELPFSLERRLCIQDGQTEQRWEGIAGCRPVLQPVVTQLASSSGPCLAFAHATSQLTVVMSGIESQIS